MAVLLSVLFGIGYGALYSVFKGVRRAVKFSAVAIFFQDIIFFELIAVVTFLLLLALEYGEIRLYVLVSILVGFCAFYLLLSEVFSRIIAAALRLLIGAFGFFCKTFGKTEAYCSKKLQNCYKYLKKHLKGIVYLVYTKNTNTVDKKV